MGPPHEGSHRTMSERSTSELRPTPYIDCHPTYLFSNYVIGDNVKFTFTNIERQDCLAVGLSAT